MILLRRAALGAVLAAGVLALAGCTQEPTVAPLPDGDEATVVLPVDQRVAAPEVVAPTFTRSTDAGPQFDLDAERGKVVVLNTWGSWCAPCRAEAPALQQVEAALGARGLVVVGLNTRDERSAARSFLETYDISYPSIDDDSGSVQLLFRDTGLPFIQGPPTTLVIDTEGRVAARHLGEISAEQLTALVEPLLPAASGSAAPPSGAQASGAPAS